MIRLALIFFIAMHLMGCQHLNPGVRVKPAESKADRHVIEESGGHSDTSKFKLRYYPKGTYELRDKVGDK